MSECNATNFSGTHIYCGIDVHKKTWNVTFLGGAPGQDRPVSMHADLEELLKVAHRRFPGCVLRCCYEAGFSGFETCRLLMERGVDCIVVNPADVPTNGRERTFKCDAMDSGKLARNLRAGNLTPVYVPTRQEEDLRAMTRRETQIRKDITATTNRLKGYYLFKGRKNIPALLGAKVLKRLEDEALASSPQDWTADSCIRHIRTLRTELDWIRRRIVERLAECGLAETYRNLLAIPGVGYRVATVFITELMDVRRFASKRQLAAYVGIAPHAHGSGSKERDCATTGRKQKQLFYLLLQASWIATMKGGEFGEYFGKRLSEGIAKRRAIISVARKLLFTICAVIRDGRPYEAGHMAEERARRAPAKREEPVPEAEIRQLVENEVAKAIVDDEELALLLPEGINAETLLARCQARTADETKGVAPEDSWDIQPL